jgi:hypothetical protein
MALPQYVALMQQTGVVTEQDLDEYCRFSDDPRTWTVYYATVAVSSR